MPDTPTPSVATAQEVLEYLTNVLRGDTDDAARQSASSPRMKAAELLGKRFGAFNEVAERPPRPVIIDDISSQPDPDDPDPDAPG